MAPRPVVLIVDFGCLHGLSDPARRAVTGALCDLAGPGATLLIGAFKAGRRILLPRGIDEDDLLAVLGDAWELQHTQSEVTNDMPPPIRRAQPTLYRLTRRQ